MTRRPDPTTFTSGVLRRMGTSRCSSGQEQGEAPVVGGPKSLLRQKIRTSIDQEDNYNVRFRTPMVLLAIVAVTILWGCTGRTAATLPDADFFVEEGSSFVLRLGDSVGVQTTSTTVIVQMSDVLGDTRCPENVTCVEAGHITLRLAVQTALAVQDVEVEVPPEGTVQVIVEEVTIDILGVRPAAQEGVTIEILDYLFLMSVAETGNIGIPQ